MEGCKSPKKPTNCGVMGFYSGVFRHRNFWSRRTASSGSIPSIDPNESLKDTSSSSKRRRGTNIDKAGFLKSTNSSEEPLTGTTATTTKQTEKSNIKYSTTAPAHVQNRVVGRRPSNAIVPASNVGGQTKTVTGRVQKEITFSGELDSYIPDYRSKVNGTLVRATSSNMMVFGHLGNIRQPGNQHNSNNVLDHLPMTAREKENAKGVNRNGVMGNIVRKPVEKEAGAGVLCRALSKRLEPEELKVMGNEEYKKGRFAEALALYDRAIAMDPDKASYRSNKSAALTGLGRLLEAIEECREAVRLEPSYTRAHHRLGSLYHRLGDAEKAQKHYKLSGDEANVKEIEKVRVVQTHLCKCNEARKLRDWHTMLKEARCAISAGADSAPQVFALQAEALLKLHRHQEADATLAGAPAFDADACTKFFGAGKCAYQLLIRALVDVAAGRFDDAVAKAHQGARLDPSMQDFVSWGIADIILTFVMAISIIIFIVGRPFYRYRVPEGSPLTPMLRVMVAAITKRNLPYPSNPAQLYGFAKSQKTDKRSLCHTNKLRFLDKAAIVEDRDDMETQSVEKQNKWRLASVTEIEEMKLVLNMVPIWISALPFGICVAQGSTFFIKQGSTMNRKITNNFTLPPATIYSFAAVAMVIIVCIYDKILVPILRRVRGNERGISILQRIGIGMALTAVAMVFAAIIERKRLHVAKREMLRGGPTSPLPMSVFWLAPQYMILGIGDGFALVGLQEYFYDQVPDTMRSLGIAFYLSVLGASNFLSSFLITIVDHFTERKGSSGWFGKDLNSSRLDCFYLLLAALTGLNLCSYVYLASRYSYKNVEKRVVDADSYGRNRVVSTP